jgi:hypothetical protein
MITRAAGTALIGMLLCAGCPLPPETPVAGGEPLITTDYDGLWQTISETGLVNNCMTILGDRVTQVGGCDGPGLTIVDAELSVRSGDQIIWTFVTNEPDAGETRHTLSLYIQPDGSLRGRYSLRFPDAALALTDNVIMVPRRVRI